MYRSLRLILLSFIAFPLLVSAQDPDLKETFLEAESYYLFEEFNEALPLYLRIHRADPDNDNINFKIGVCFLNDPYQKDKAIRYLEEASKNTNPDYRINRYKERTAPVETFFYLGKAYLVNNQIEKALENFRHFRDILDEKVYDVELVEEQISICQAAMDLKTKPVDFDKSNLGEPLNSRYAEINPIISGDGNRLVYVAKLPFYDATYYSEKVNGEWLPPRNIIPELGVDGDVYPTCLSYDGTTMIIYRNDDFIGNLYSSKLIDGRWTSMQKLGGSISTKYWESHGCLTKDGKTLYFTSNRKEGYGGLDIYRSDLQPDGEWGEPVNLGPEINTRYNEETPFITENGKFLFFSSYGHYNMGGYDIFYSRLDENGRWANPVNIGYPINTTDDDLFFQPVNNGKSAYYSIYDLDGFGRHDLYYLDIYSADNPRMYMVTGSLLTDKGLITSEDDVKLYLIDRETGDTVDVIIPDLDDNSFRVELPRGVYDLVIRSKTFKDAEQTLTIDEDTEKTGIQLSDEILLETRPYEPKLLTGDDSRIVVRDTVITTDAGETVRIRMRLPKDSELVVKQLRDGETVATDTFSIDSRRFTYEMVPEAGETILELRLTEPNGDVSLRTLIINGTTEEKEKEDGEAVTDSARVMQPPALPDDSYEPVMNQDSVNASLEQILEKLKLTTSEDASDGAAALAKTLEALDVGEMGLTSTGHFLDTLVKMGPEKGYDRSDVYVMAGETIAGGDMGLLRQVLYDHATGALKEYLGALDTDSLGIETIRDLIDHLLEVADEAGFTEADLRRALAAGLDNELSEAELIKYSLMETAGQELRDVLEKMDLDEQGILTQEDFFRFLDGLTGEGAEALRDYLIAKGPESLKEFLMQLDLEKEGIKTISDLIAYLLEHIDSTGITREELMALIAGFLEDALTSMLDAEDAEVPEKVRSTGMTVITIVASAGFLAFVFFLVFRRRRKDKGGDE